MIQYLHSQSFRNSFLTFAFAIVSVFGLSLFGQTQSSSIRNGVTFVWSDVQDTNNNNNVSGEEDNRSATISSISVGGEEYTTFAVPSTYQLTRLGVGDSPGAASAHSVNQIKLNNATPIGNSTTATLDMTDSTPWDDAATAAFQSKNLNHYFTSNPNGRDFNTFAAAATTDAQKQTIFYNPAIPSNAGGILAVTERGGNNSYYIEMYGTLATGGSVRKLGETFVRTENDYRFNDTIQRPPINNNTDYWVSGRSNENGQNIAIALFNLNSVAPTGSKITRIEFVASTRDHGDGKFFILQKYAVDQTEIGCLDQPFEGDLSEGNGAPDGSTYSIVTPPSLGGQWFELNEDGTYSYMPPNNFTGEVVFEYEVCLPAPNTTVCDTGMVTLTFVDRPDVPIVELYCNGGTTSTTDLVITSPVGSQFQYSLNEGEFQTSATFSNLNEGEYRVIVKNVNTGCKNENATTVTIDNLEIEVPIETIDLDCKGDETGAIDITITGGLEPYSIVWLDDADVTTEDRTGLSAGTYTIEVTDAYGCTVTGTATINEPDAVLSGDVTATDESNINANDGTASAQGIGGTPEYNYLWNTGATTSTIDNLDSGDYTVTITDSLGCIYEETVTVNAAEQLPEAVDDSRNVNENTALNIDPLINDTFGGDGPNNGSIIVASNPSNGTAEVLNNGTPNDPTDDTVLYTPNNGFNGIDTLQYTITDASGDTATATITIIVSDVIVVPPGERGCNCTPLYGNSNFVNPILIEGNDLQIGSKYRFSDIFPGNGNDQVIDAIVEVMAFNNGATLIDIDVDDQGISRAFQPELNSTNSGDQSIIFDISFVEGATMTLIDISFFGTPFDIDGDSVSTREYAELSLPDAYYKSANTLIEIEEKEMSIRGSVVNPTNAPGGIISEDPRFTFSNYWEGANKLSYTIGKENGNIDRFYALVLDNANYTNPESTILTAPVICGNVSDEGGDPIANTTINISGTDGTNTTTTTDVNGDYRYATSIPSAEVDVTYTITEVDQENYVSISDVDGANDNIITRVVNLRSTCGNDYVDDGRPLALNDAAQATPLQTVDIDVLDNDIFGPDGPSTGAISIVTPPLRGTAVVDNNGTPNDPTDDFITYTAPLPNLLGEEFEYQICDSDGDCDTAVVVVNIVDDNPEADDDTFTVDEDSVDNALDVLTNDDFGNDGDGSITLISNTTNGTVTLNTNGTPGDATDDFFEYTPNPDFNGTDTFEYEISDADNDTDTAVVLITVMSVNDEPVANDDDVPLLEDDSINIDVLGNDTFGGDGEGNVPVIITVNAVNGTATVNNGGTPNDPTDDTIDYTPNPDYNGTDTITYQIEDADGDTDTAVVNIDISELNDLPVALDDAVTIDEDTTLVNIDVLDNDSFGGDGPSSTPIIITVNAQNGTASVNDGGTPNDPTDDTIDYTPNADFNGTDTFTYQIEDSNGDLTSAEVVITVGAVDDVVDDTATTLEDVAVTIDVLDNDGFDPTADVQITNVTAPANGTVSIVNNQVVYTPNADYNGTDTFDYTVTVNNPDGTTTTETATVVVTVRPVDANDDTATTQEDTPVTVDVFDNDILGDPAIDTAAVTAVTDPANGTVTINGDGTVTYTPDADFNGTDTFEYTLVVTDANGDTSSETATVTVTVGAVDDVVDDTATTLEDVAVTIDVLDNDGFDPTADVQITDVTAPANGTVSIVNNQVVYTPDADFNGDDTFDYTVTVTNPDGTTTTETATVVVTVRPVDANDDTATTQEDTPVTVDVFDNDILGDPAIDTAAVTAVTDPANGTVTINGDGTVTYTPDADFNGTDTFEYTLVVTDANGDTSSETATVTVTVGAVDDVVDDTATTLEDVAVTIDVLDNDGFDPTADVQITNVTAPANGTVSIVNNQVVYTPNADYNGTDTFDYTVTVTNPDGTTSTETATVVVTVRPVDANDDTATTQEDTPVTVDVFDNDILGDPAIDTAAVTAVTDPANGTVTINGDGTVTYTPDADFNGTDTFEYTLVVTDANGDTSSETATVTVTVGAVDDVVDDTATTLEDVAVTIDVLANDGFGPTADVQITDVTAPLNGTVAIVDNQVVYTPNADYNGTDTFDYTVTVTNPDGTTSTETATVVVTVRPVDANDDTATTQEDTPVTVDVFDNDILGDPAIDTAAVTAVTDPANGTVTINGDGTVTYTPDADFNGTDTFEYTLVVTDANGDTSSETATVTVTVGAVDDVVDDTATTLEDVAVTIDVLDNDGFDPTADVQITNVTAPANGTVSIVNNQVVYTPNADYNGTDTFDYTVTVTNPDGTTSTETATVVVTVRPVDANDDTAATQEDTPVTVDVFDNDVLGDPAIDTAAVTAVTDPANGTVTINGDGTVTYTPDADFNGTDTFDYTLVVTAPNGTTSTETATVTITVGAVDDVVDDTATTLEDVAVTIDVLDNDGFDPTADVQITDVTVPANGTVSIVNNQVVYTPDVDYNGTDTFDYTVTVTNPDGTTTTETATVVVTVRPVDANDDTATTQEDTPVTVDVFDNDILGDSAIDTAAVTAVTDPANGTVTINGDGTVTYTPDANFNGTDTFEYTLVVTDVDGNTSTETATVTIIVIADNPSLELLKDGVYVDTNGDDIVNEGDIISYTFTVTNTGDVVLFDITISDPLPGVIITGGPITLQPQESNSDEFTGTYAITQADIDDGGVFNLATVSGEEPGNDPNDPTDDITDDSEDPTPVDPSEVDPDCPDCTVTILDQTPSLELLKDGVYVDTNGDGITNVGDTVTYSFTVTNTGNVTITNITISDPLVTVNGGPIDLIPGAVDTDTFTATYEITLDDINAGAVFNLATVQGEDPNGDPVTDDSEDPTPVDPSEVDPDCPDCTVTTLDQTPSLELLKDGVYVDTNGDGITNVGDTVTYSFTVTNTGNVTITNITISDPLVTVNGGPIDLIPGAVDTDTFTATYEITLDDINAGAVFNLATVQGEDPNGDPVTDDSEDPTPVDPSEVDPDCPDCTVTTLDQTPSLELLKDGVYVDTNGDGITNVGDTVTYSFTVTNTGNVTITNITISDPLVTVNGGPIDLIPGAVDTDTFTATYEITLDDINAGAVFNLATVQGEDPNGDPVTDDSEDPTPVDPSEVDPDCPDCTVTTLDQTPSLELLKDGVYVDTNGDGITNVGDTVTYSFTVTNTGNVTITNITISDPLVTVNGGPIDLIPGAVDTDTFTATYEITLDDINAGAVFNLATVQGEDPNGDPVTDDSEDPTPVDPSEVDPDCPDCTVTTLDQTPSLELLKDGVYVDTNGDGITNVGDTVTYSFTVTNTGNVTITNITISDPLVTVNGGPIDLIPGAVDTDTFTATYEITLDDINAGAVFNLATVQGEDPNGDPVTDDSEDPTPVDPSEVDPDCPDCTVTTLDQTPSLELLKDGVYVDTNGDGITNVGDTVTYSFTVTNTGNVTITNITISDPLVTVNGGPIDLISGAVDTDTFTATYEITLDDINAGAVFNLATVQGEDPNGDPVTDDSEDPTPVDPSEVDPDCPDCTVTPLDQTPSIALVKVGTFLDENGDGFAQEGETISYAFTVTNTGNVTLINVVITDPLVTVTGGPIDIEPGVIDTDTFTASYTITLSDIDNGSVENQALAIGQGPDGDDVTDMSDDTSDLEDDITVTELPQMGAITLIKRGIFNDENNDGISQVGETITYTFTVFNTGNVTVSNIVITDPLVEVTGGPISLDPNQGDSETFSAVYAITQDDIDRGFVENQALALGQDPNGNDVSDLSDEENPLEDDPTITDLPFGEGAIALIKTGVFNDANGDGLAQVGETITYSFTVTNVGAVTLSNITISDPLVSVVGGPITLAPGESDSTTFTATYVITQADLDIGNVENQAIVTGETPTGDEVSDMSDDNSDLEDDVTVTDLPVMASIALIKEGMFNDLNGDGFAQAGETITYTFIVTNTGVETVTNIIITDPLVEVTGGPIDLGPGETDSTTFMAVYVITDEDINAGGVSNQAIATGQDPNGDDVSDTSDDDSELEDDPTITDLPDDGSSISLEKEGEWIDLNGDGFAQEGEIIMYTFTVINTGDVALTNVTVSDPLPGITVEGGPIDLAIGESDSTTFTATYVLTEEDIAQNLVVNQASVTAFNGTNTIDDLSDDPNDPTDFDDNGDGEPDDPTITVFEGVLNESDLIIYNGISDNGDTFNDSFIIEGIENFPSNTVQIFNRWGVQVYERIGYKNDSEAFKGVSDGRWTIRQGERLPEGTYYYIIVYVTEDGPRQQAGYLYINR